MKKQKTNRIGVDAFCARLDEIFKTGMITKAQVIEAYNKSVGEAMPTQEVDELEEYVRLLKVESEKMPKDKHDLLQKGKQEAYSHCWFTFRRMVEKFRNRMNSSEKPNNSEGRIKETTE